jgi:hypothetical protein
VFKDDSESYDLTIKLGVLDRNEETVQKENDRGMEGN